MRRHVKPYPEEGQEYPKIIRERKHTWRNVVAELRARPCVWHQLPEEISTITTVVNQGRLLDFYPRSAFEACTQAGVLYLRYVGSRPE